MSSSVQKTNFKVLNRYSAFFTSGKVQATKDGESLLCQCGNLLNVLHLNTGVVVHSIGQDDDVELTNFILSPDNEILVTANTSLVLRHWNYSEKKVVRTWKSIHVARVSCMAFDPTSTLLATGSSDSTIKVWDMLKQYCTHNLRAHQGVVSVVQFHPTKLQLYSAADDYVIRAWDLETSQCVAVLEGGHSSVVTSLQISPDGDALYSAGRDSSVLVWNLESFIKTKTVPVYECVESLLLLSPGDDNAALNATSPDQMHFIVGGAQGKLRVFNAHTSGCVFPTSKSTEDKATLASSDVGADQSDELAQRNEIKEAFYIGARDQICVVTSDRDIILYDRKDLGLSKQFAGHVDVIQDIKFLGLNDSHIAVATNSQLIKIFEVDTWACQILSGHSDFVISLDVYQKDELNLLVSGSKDNSIRLWSMNADTKIVSCIAVGRGHERNVGAVTFSKGSPKYLATSSVDRSLKVWLLDSKVISLASAPAGSSATVEELHATLTEQAHDKDINCITVAPNSGFIATGSQDKTVKLWKYDDSRWGSPRVTLGGILRGHKSGVWGVQFSPVDQALVTASADSTLKLWDIQTYSCLKTFSGHESSALSVHFLVNGSQLISSGSDGTVKLWSLKDQECLKTFDEHEEKVWAMAVDKEEKRVVTGAGDSTIIIWKDVTEEEIREERSKRDDFTIKEQKLSNLLQQKNYVKALRLTIIMDQPFRALNIIKEILKSGGGDADLSMSLEKLRDDQIASMLKFAVAWNDNSKNCHVAQAVLGIVLRKYSVEQLLAFPDIQSIVEGLLPYTEKHHERMTKYVQKATFVDYMWQSMRPPPSATTTDTNTLAADEESEAPVNVPAGNGSIENEVDMEVVSSPPENGEMDNGRQSSPSKKDKKKNKKKDKLLDISSTSPISSTNTRVRRQSET